MLYYIPLQKIGANKVLNIRIKQLFTLTHISIFLKYLKIYKFAC